LAKCSYFYHTGNNNGVVTIQDMSMRMLICRKCEKSPCVNSCPQEALEKQPDGVLKRYSMRCTSCKSCTVVCPFGATFPDIVPYKTSQCDFCIDNGKYLCAETCPEKAINYAEVEESKEKNVYFVGDKLAVHSNVWRK
jgi:Fe-S-cluster-containing hydrogenase component 2